MNLSQNNLSTIYSNNLKSFVKLIFSATTCKWITILQGNQSSTQKFTAVLSVHMLCSAGSRPWDKGGVSKKFFRPFGPQFGLKLRGGGAGPRAPPLDPPLFWDGLRICICLGESKSEFPVTEFIIQTKGRSSYNWYGTGIGSLPRSRFGHVTSRALRDKKKGRVRYWMILLKCKH